MIVAGLFFGFGLLWLILAILLWQDARNDKLLQELKRLKKERKQKKKKNVDKKERSDI